MVLLDESSLALAKLVQSRSLQTISVSTPTGLCRSLASLSTCGDHDP